MARLELSFLGPLQVKLDGQLVSSFEADKVRALLAFLAVESERPHRRELLATLFWPGWPDTSARTSLRNALSNLRKAIGDETARPPFLLITRETIQFNPKSDYSLDTFELEFVSKDSHATADQLQSALDCYRGDFLEGFTLKDCPAFDDWFLVVREQLQAHASTLLSCLGELYEIEKQYDKAIGCFRKRLTLEPWQEEAYRQLMRLLSLNGQRSAALAQYEACKRNLKSELGVEPSVETVKLYESIRDSTSFEPNPSKAHPHNLPVQLTSFIGREREMGEIKKLLAGTHLLTLTGIGGAGKTRLALQVSADLIDEYPGGVWLVELAPLHDPAFVERSVASVLGVSEQPDRLLSDLLVEYVREKHLLLILDNCEHVIETCVQLADLLLRSAPGLKILSTSRVNMNLAGEINYAVPPLPLPDPERAAPAPVLAQYEAVRLFIERATAVQPSFRVTNENAPAVAQICTHLDGIPLAIELAAARIRLLSPDQISARLDDRFNLLTGGSRTALPRQQTLRATMDWSYDLLPEVERNLFNRLAVFPGSFSLESVEAICIGALVDGSPTHRISPSQTLEVLGALVDHSLVSLQERNADTRYVLLETVRQYALENLQASGELPTLKVRHLQYCLDFAIQGEQYLHGPEQVTWQKRLVLEIHNFRAALGWALEQDVHAGLHLALTLGWVWYVNNTIVEGTRWLSQLIDKEELLPEAQERSPDQHWLHLCGLFATGRMDKALSMLSGEKEKQVSPRVYNSLSMEWVWWKNVQYYEDFQAIQHLIDASTTQINTLIEQYRSQARTLGIQGKRILAVALNTWGLIFGTDPKHLEELGDRYIQGRNMFRLALELSQQAGNAFSISEAWGTGLGNFNLYHNFKQAVSDYQEALRWKEQIGDLEGIAHIKDRMAAALNGLGDFSAASQLLGEALESYNETGGYARWKLALNTKGTLTWCLGDEAGAEKLYRLAQEHSRDKDFDYHLAGYYLGCLAYLRQNYVEAEHHLKEFEGFFRQREGKIFWADHYLGVALFGLGEMALHQGNIDRARRYLEDALVHHLKTPHPLLHAMIHFSLGKASRRQGELEGARQHYREALPHWGPRLGNPGLACTLQALADLEEACGRPENAVRLLGSASAILPRLRNRYFFLYIIRLNLEPVDTAAAEAAARQGLGDEAFTTAFDAGAALTDEQVYNLALEICEQ